MDRLTDDEMHQLKTLLVRYLAYHAKGVFSMAVDALLAKFKGAPVIDVTPNPEPPPPSPQARRQRSQRA